MKLRLYLFLAATSIVLVSAVRVESARRPRYGGKLRLEIGAALNSIDPGTASANPDEAVAKNRIAGLIYDHRNPGGTFAGAAGSGPFRISEWQPGKLLSLVANETYPGGRPFLDSIEIQMARPARERLLDLEAGKIDFAEIPPEQARLASDRGVRVSASQPDELIALVAVSGRSALRDARAREALSLSIDRAAIVNFILQKEGEPAGGLLPQWSNGTAFLFSTAADPADAKDKWSQIPGSPKIVLGYDSGDPLEQTIAERIAVNAREAGILITAQALPISQAANCDARLVRLKMPSGQPAGTLKNFFSAVGSPVLNTLPSLPAGASAQQIYEVESAVVAGYRIIPLVWLPQVYGLGARVRDWEPPAPDESWPLADVWIEQESR